VLDVEIYPVEIQMSSLENLLQRWVLKLNKRPSVSIDPLCKAQLRRTAHQHKDHLGWVTITHPFHPLRGLKFEILQIRSFQEKKLISLKKPTGGTFAIPHEWTDLDNSPQGSTILSIPYLLALVDMTKQISEKQQNKV
jgi:Family of unknown function (DUF5372)